MTARNDFSGVLSDWLEEQAGRGAPDYLDDVLVRTARTRQRPAWSSLERILPMQTTLRLVAVPRLAWLLLILGVVLAIVAGALFVGSRQRQLPPPFGVARNGAVLYGGTDGDIHALDAASGASSALIGGAERDRNPSLAPDGSRFLFLRDTAVPDPTLGGSEPMIMVANADGTGVRALTGALANFNANVWARSAAWSSDGSLVAVASDVAGAPALVVFRVDRAEAPTVIDTRGMTAAFVTFRPGDRELTFVGSKVDSTGLYAVGADGLGLRTILASVGDYASLSPDGTQIAFQGDGGRADVFGAVHVVDVTTGVDRIPPFQPAAFAADDDPSWSPDGTKLLFQRYDGGSYRMAVAPAIGGPVVEIGPTRPQNNGERVGAQFSPDGLSVLAHYDGDGSTWLLDLTGATDGTQLSSAIAATATWQRLAP